MIQGLESRVLRTQGVICLATAVAAVLWSLWFESAAGIGWSRGLWQGLASSLGSIAVMLPSAWFAWWARRRALEAIANGATVQEQAQRTAQRILAGTGLRLIGTMTLMVIAFALVQPQAGWVLIGIAAATIGQVLAAATSSRTRP